MRETTILAKLIRMRDDLDIIVEAALDKANSFSVEKDEWFEAALEAKRWSNIRGCVEDAIAEIEGWE